jgi:hypothetical protein
MIRFTHQLCHFRPRACTLLRFLGDALRFLCLCLRPSPMLAAGNLFLCKQLSLYQERHLKPRLATDAARFTLVWLARGFDWRQALLWSNPQRFSAGIARDSGCSGDGNPGRDAH